MACRILYVDDNKDSLELVNFMLNNSDLKHEVVSADCAESAISLMENQTFDLYIIDYSLPQISGTELCRFIRQSDSQKPIMFFTAMARPADRDAGIEAGANEYLVKPNDLERLTETVKRLLDEYSSSCSSISKLHHSSH